MYVFQYSIICFSFTSEWNLFFINVVILDCSGDIFIPDCSVVLCKVYDALYK